MAGRLQSTAFKAKQRIRQIDQHCLAQQPSLEGGMGPRSTSGPDQHDNATPSRARTWAATMINNHMHQHRAREQRVHVAEDLGSTFIARLPIRGVVSRDPDTNCSVGRSFIEGIIASKEDEKKRRKAVPIATQATVAQKRMAPTRFTLLASEHMAGTSRVQARWHRNTGIDEAIGRDGEWARMIM